MMQLSFEQQRIAQLISLYAPDDPPRVPLDFGDYLSLLWRLDRHAEDSRRVLYYRQCATSLGEAMQFHTRSIHRLVKITEPGKLYANLANAPYRATTSLVDALDRKAAINQLVVMRNDILRVGTYQEGWGVSWPGSGITDSAVRERVFAVLFTAFEGQYQNFGRLLLVIDIVLGDLLIGQRPILEVPLETLVRKFNYPNPRDNRTHQMYFGST